MSYTINLIKKSKTGVITTDPVTEYVVQGFSYLEKLDDSLDTGNITLRGVAESTPYGMYDTIECKFNTTVIWSMRIAGDSVSLISKSPKLYEHNISLVEHTKILENFIISGKTFTQPTDPTDVANKYTLYKVIETLRLTVPLETDSLLLTTRLFIMPSSGELYDLLNNTDSPEFTFKDVTLREALIQVCDYIDGIPRLIRLSNGDLQFSVDFVNDLKTLITSTDDYITNMIQQDIDLYATELESEALNMVEDTIIGDNVETYPSKNSYTTLRTDEYIFDFTKSYIPTPKEIYNIGTVIARFPHTVRDDNGNYLYGSSAGSSAYFDIRIKDLIVESSRYKELPQLLSGAIWIDGLPYSKQTTLPYVQYKKNVVVGTTYGLFNTNVSLEDVMGYSIYQMMIDDGFIADGTPIANVTILADTVSANLEDTYFQIDYTAVPKSSRVKIQKNTLNDVNKDATLLSNQRERIINIESFTNNLFGKINRIGNSELQLENRYTTPLVTQNVIGDYTDDLYIITEKESIYFTDYVHVKYGLSRDFNKISSFIGVNSEVRQWEIGEKNTLERNIIYKEFIEIDCVNSGDGGGDTILLTTSGINTYLDTFKATSLLEPARGGYLTSSDIGFGDDVLLSFSNVGGGNSLIFTWKFEDNITVGSKLDTSTAQKVNDFVPYTAISVDNKASQSRLEFAQIVLFDKLNSPASESTNLTRANNYPFIDISAISTKLIDTTSAFKLLKDNREILGGTISFQQLSKRPKDVILGRWLSVKNRFISESPPTSFKLYRYSGGIKFSKTDNLKALNGAFSINSITPTVEPSKRKVTFIGASASDSAWCITDENDFILIACNQDGTLLNTITFNFNNKNSSVNYKY